MAPSNPSLGTVRTLIPSGTDSSRCNHSIQLITADVSCSRLPAGQSRYSSWKIGAACGAMRLERVGSCCRGSVVEGVGMGRWCCGCTEYADSGVLPFNHVPKSVHTDTEPVVNLPIYNPLDYRSQFRSVKSIATLYWSPLCFPVEARWFPRWLHDVYTRCLAARICVQHLQVALFGGINITVCPDEASKKEPVAPSDWINRPRFSLTKACNHACHLSTCDVRERERERESKQKTSQATRKIPKRGPSPARRSQKPGCPYHPSALGPENIVRLVNAALSKHAAGARGAHRNRARHFLPSVASDAPRLSLNPPIIASLPRRPFPRRRPPTRPPAR